MFPMVAMAALSAAQAGASFISAKGAADATAKQGRLQMMEDARQRNENQALARELMLIPEVTSANVSEFMAAGKAAGYNPVTWLNSGALSLFKTTTGHNTAAAMAMMTGTPTQIPRVPSPLEGLGGALSSGLNTFSSLFQTQMKIDALSGSGNSGAYSPSSFMNGWNNTSTVLNSMLGGAGFAPRSFSTSGGAASAAGGMTLDPYWPKWKTGDVEITNPWMSWKVDKSMANAEAIEDTYGDAMSWIYGAYKFANDVVLNTSGTSLNSGIANTWVGNNWDGSTRSTPIMDYLNSYLPNPNRTATPYMPFPGAGPGVTWPDWYK